MSQNKGAELVFLWGTIGISLQELTPSKLYGDGLAHTRNIRQCKVIVVNLHYREQGGDLNLRLNGCHAWILAN